MAKENYFNNWNKGDAVLLVTDSLRIEEDTVMNTTKDQEKNRNVFLHLSKSKRIVDWESRFYIYPKDKSERLKIVVNVIINSPVIQWYDNLRELMEETNTPLFLSPPHQP